MVFPSASPDASPHQRGPLDGLKPAGGDMSIFFIARVPPLTRFGSPEEQQIKGLNFETIASVNFPTPAWLHDPAYAALQPKDDDENIGSAPFSLNLSMYDQAVSDPSDWNDQCFFLYGTVHPYALTWEIGPSNDSDAADEPQNYTIPSLIVRDQCYQPYIHRLSFVILHTLTLTYFTEFAPACSVRRTASLTSRPSSLSRAPYLAPA